MAKSRKDKADDKTAAEDSLSSEDPKTGEETGVAGTDPAGEDTVGQVGTEPLGDDTATAPDTVDPTGEDSLAPMTESPVAADPDAERIDIPEAGADVAPFEEDDTLAGETADTVSGQQDQDAFPPDPEAPQPEPVAAEPQVIRETIVERKGGFVSMLLGGVVAAALGYAAGAYPDLPFMGGEPEEDPFVTQTLAALRSQGEQIEGLAKLSSETAETVDAIDLAPLSGSVTAAETRLADIDTSLTAFESALTGLSDKVAGIDTRLTTIEKRPLVDAVSPETVAAYERELDALKAQVAAQQAAIAAAQEEQLAAVENARKEIEAVAERARASEASAETRAKLAASRAALADLTTRARDGQPYAEPLAVLTENGVDVPAPLVQGAEDGLPTASLLITEFPEAARNALSAARAAGTDGAEDGSLAGFFQSQLGARSVTPRDGDDPDAVLSRAEAALKGGDLDGALSEISALPEAAQGELSDWVALATLRRDALAATAELSQELNQE